MLRGIGEMTNWYGTKEESDALVARASLAGRLGSIHACGALYPAEETDLTHGRGVAVRRF